MVMHTPTLSGTFLQTLPQLVMPLNGELISAHVTTLGANHALSIAFRHEGCRKSVLGIWVLIRLSEHARKTEARPPGIKRKRKKKFRLGSSDFGFIRDGVSNVDGYKRNATYNLSGLLQTYVVSACYKVSRFYYNTT